MCFSVNKQKRLYYTELIRKWPICRINFLQVVHWGISWIRTGYSQLVLRWWWGWQWWRWNSILDKHRATVLTGRRLTPDCVWALGRSKPWRYERNQTWWKKIKESWVKMSQLNYVFVLWCLSLSLTSWARFLYEYSSCLWMSWNLLQSKWRKRFLTFLWFNTVSD